MNNVEHIERAVRSTGGNVTAAAARLGVPKRTLDRRLTKSGARARIRAEMSPPNNGGRPAGNGGKPKRPRSIQTVGPENRVRVERECDADGEFISLADAHGNMVTLKFAPCIGGSAKGDGRGRLADLIVRPDGRSQCEFISAEIQATSADERRRRMCLENAIVRVCGPVVAAQVHEEARRST